MNFVGAKRLGLSVIAFLPVAFLYLVVFAGGLILSLAHAFGWFPALGADTWTLAYFEDALAHPDFWVSLRVTLFFSVTSTALACALGSVFAAAAAEVIPWPRAIDGFLRFSLGVPHLVTANLVLLLFDQSGFASRVAHAVGWIGALEEFPVLVNDGKSIGTILGFLFKETVFVALLVLPAALAARKSHGRVAASLGAGPWQRLWHVTLPLCAPAWGAAAVLLLGYSLGAVEIPAVLGTTYPKALAVWALEDFGSVDPQSKIGSFALGALNLAVSSFAALALLSLLRTHRSSEGARA